MTSVAPSSRPESARRVAVAVVGAGISGLAVARGLDAAGLEVLVLERRSRVGGRLLSQPSSDGVGRLDLGATWFWEGEQRVAGLLTDLDLPAHPQHLEGDAVYQEGAGCERMSRLPTSGGAWRFSAGAQSLAESLADELDPSAIELDTTVSSVRGVGPLVVDTERGAVVADHVVLALPPALAAQAITFDPPLPEQLATLASLTPVWMGPVTKVVARYARRFWADDGLSGAAVSRTGPLREIHDMSGPDGAPAALFGFARAGAHDPQVGPEDVLHQLAAIFGPQAASPSELVITDWRSDPATSPTGVAHLGEYRTFAHPLYQVPTPDRALYWSSTETGDVAPGHIEGALAAAERTVRMILEQADLPGAVGQPIDRPEAAR